MDTTRKRGVGVLTTDEDRWVNAEAAEYAEEAERGAGGVVDRSSEIGVRRFRGGERRTSKAERAAPGCDESGEDRGESDWIKLDRSKARVRSF